MPHLRFTTAYNLSIDYELTATGFDWWQLAGSSLKTIHPIRHPQYNHHLGYDKDCELPSAWRFVRRACSELDIPATAEPTQQQINAIHAFFLVRWRQSPYLWCRLNCALHYVEHYLQDRGQTTAIDVSQWSRQRWPLPSTWTFSPIRQGGLYLMYQQIGRNWEEIFRARDLEIPISQHVEQSEFTAGVMLQHTDYSIDLEPALEKDFYDKRAWNVDFEKRQRGLVLLGTRITPTPHNWERSPVISVKLT